MITCEVNVGRLMEVRFVSPIPPAELTAYTDLRRRAALKLGHERVVCVDFSRCDVLPPELADQLGAQRVGVIEPLRNAVLVPADRATLGLQIERILREAKNPVRRAFRKREELIVWLDEVLRPDERVRLRSFLTDAR